MRHRLLLAIAGLAACLAALRAENPRATSSDGGAIESLRRLQDTSIAFEVQVITAPAEIKLGPCPAKEGEVALLTDAQRGEVLKAAQAGLRVNVLQTPKVTTFDGQEAVIRNTEKQFFVTGVEAHRVKGQAVLVPKNVPVETGTTLTLRGQLSADNKYVTVNASYVNTRVEGKVELIPVVTQITPVSEDGSKAKPVPFTHYLQSPQIETVKIEKTGLKVPACGSVVIAGPVSTLEVREEYGPPSLAKVPYLNRLFKNVGYSKVPVRTYLVVSPRVIEPAGEDPAPRVR